MPAWEVTGENPTRWIRLVWYERRKLYMKEYSDKQQRELQKMNRKNNSGF